MRMVTIPAEFYHLLMNLRDAVGSVGDEYDDEALDRIDAAFEAVATWELETGAHLPV